ASPNHDPEKPFEHIGYTVPWNMAENPAISINGGYDAQGFPIGVQIIGRRFDDHGVLALAKAFEGLRGPQKPWPAPPKKKELNNNPRHARPCAGHPRLSSRGSEDVDGRDKPGHDEEQTLRGNRPWPTKPSNTRSRSRSSPSR